MRVNHKLTKIWAIASCLALSNVAVSQPDKEDGEFLIDGIIIKYSEEYKSKPSKELKDKISLIAGEEIEYKKEGPMGTHLLKLKNKKIKTSKLRKITDKLTKHKDIEYAEPDAWIQHTATPNDTEYYRQWHYSELTGGAKLPAAWDRNTGTGAVVAVLDTGILSHPDLSAQLLTGYDFVHSAYSNDGDGWDSDPTDPGDWTSTSDSTWHGTHVAGTVAATTNNFSGVAGAAYGAKIVPVRVLGAGGGTLSGIAYGMNWAVGVPITGIPTNQNPADVLNMSLSGANAACGPTYTNAIIVARNHGAVVVVAAGNNNYDAAGRFPANCPDAITVAANTRSATKAWYSNFGSIVDVSAPGGEGSSSDAVYSTSNSGTTVAVTNDYEYKIGTSMAAPHVSGVAALLYSLRPDIDNETVELILTHSATDRQVTGCSNCGSGIVDAETAVSMVCTTRSYTTKELEFMKAYQAYLGRVPDPGGLDWHVANTSGNDITPRMPTFLNTSEFTTVFGVSYGSIVPAHYANIVHQVYTNLFGHSADSSGLNFYVGLLNAGTETIDTIGLRIANSAVGSDATVRNNRLALSEHYVDQQKDAGNPTSPNGNTLRAMSGPISDVDTVMLDGCAEANGLVW